MTAHSPAAANDKRERILDAAERIFARDGFFAAKVADVAKDAGVADGTIYLYFKSKDDLLISLFETRMERVISTLTAAIAPVKGAHAKLLRLVETYLGLIKDQPSTAEIMTVELRQSAKFMKQDDNPKFAELLRIIAGVVADGQAAGELGDRIPPAIAARMIFGVLDELAVAWLLSRDASSGRGAPRGKKFDIVRAADWVGELVTNGLSRRSDS
jgi:TetR/AcrR family transcriptional regulator, fatty acid metabolism regulator protein